MHKFYWRNTHGPGERVQDQTYYRMGKSGSADNILSEASSTSTSAGGCDDLFGVSQPQHSGMSLVRRIRRLSGRAARPKSVADIVDLEDDLSKNLANLRLANSQAQEYNSIEHLEAAQYAQTYTRPQYEASHYAQVRSGRCQAQVRNSHSLHFTREEKSRTWNPGSVARYRQEEEFCPVRHKRLSVSSFRYEDPPATSPHPRTAFREKVQRSLSCDRTKHASKQVVKSIKISSDKIQENLTKISSNLNSRLDTHLSTLSCMAGEVGEEEEEGVGGTDWYQPPSPAQYEDTGSVRLTTPTTSLGRHHQTALSNVFSCTKPQSEEMANMDRLSHTMRGKMHTANKKLSMIRSKSMERFSKRNQELIVVTPRERTQVTESDNRSVLTGPVLGQAVAIMDFTPNPYDREALSLKRGDVIDVMETNPNGTWRGHCNGRVGSFKFLTVQTLPDRRSHLPSHHLHQMASVDTVQEVLAMVGLEHLLSVFILNGQDSLASLYRLDRAGLDYLGLTDTDKQTELLQTIQSLVRADSLQERDSGCYSGAVGSSSGSGESERSESLRSRRSRQGRGREANLNKATVLMQELTMTTDI